MSLLQDLFGGSSREESRREYQGVGPNAGMLAFLDKTIGRPFSISELWSLSPQSHSLFRGADNPAGGFTTGREDSPIAQPQTQGPVKFTMADITAAYQFDPEKLMDVQRVFKGSHMDPNGFTLQEWQDATDHAGWASGRSKGNFTRVSAELANRQQVFGAYQTNRFAPPQMPDLTQTPGMPPLS